ncbi:Inositol 2-dehydrogenase [Botrimarina colliarenosi]|uniref:Inositol 2-dehydrogenase n=1 Tax=Botrimarina colliarenosi TaxID=2528001 RepID=A0A5C6A0W4_9BACT|nr:Gfo/Idh/MocA family oxidoreductase [Botrimarina colliarenosi]TWT92881.1 Inositol 2-dehydrogenase [Botrimarina colliarenosi]
MPINPPADSSRRAFLKQSAAVGSTLAAALAASPLARAAHTGADETLRVGLVGCGGRGRGAAIDALNADPGAKLVAVGDAFMDRAKSGLAAIEFEESIADRVAVDSDHTFDGFDCFKKVIDSEVDVILLATPPHFRPEHLAYAVEKGKHVFVEKPISVDMAGAERVAQTCEVAASKGLSIVSGLCWRYDLGVLETMKRIEDGAIGDIVAIESCYNSGTLWHRGDKPDWSRMEYQLRNWLYYTWLSGDIIAEQAIHSLDKTAWLLGDQSPTKAMAMGGRQQRTDPKYGNVFDHFTVFYEYPTGQSVYFTCRQQDGCTMRVDEVVHGTKGKAEILAGRIWTPGGSEWRYDGPKPSMYLNEHVEFFKSIRAGEPINNGHYMVNSTRIAHLGRMAAYTGKTTSWSDAIADPTHLGPQDYSWTDVPEPSVAIPGILAKA